MQNAHLRLGRLEYRRSTRKTETSISIYVSRYVGDAESAHLLSFFGHDAEMAAVTGALQENHRFQLRFPDGRSRAISVGPDASCYKGNLSLPGQRPLRHVVAISAELHSNGSAGRTYVLNDEPESEQSLWSTLALLLGLPADPSWGAYMLAALRDAQRIRQLEGIGCAPAVVQTTRQELLAWMGRECAAGHLPFPEVNGPVQWPSVSIRHALSGFNNS